VVNDSNGGNYGARPSSRAEAGERGRGGRTEVRRCLGEGLRGDDDRERDRRADVDGTGYLGGLLAGRGDVVEGAGLGVVGDLAVVERDPDGLVQVESFAAGSLDGAGGDAVALERAG
jgi:hypothetical protein